MEKFLVLLAVAICTELGSAQSPVPFNGTCTELCEPKTFNTTAGVIELEDGIWFLQLAIPFFSFQQSKCVFINFTQVSTVSLFGEVVDTSIETSKERRTYGLFEFTSDGEVNVTYTEIGLQLNFQVIALTEDYAVFSYCSECGFFGEVDVGYRALIFTRLQFPSCEVLEEATKEIELCGVSRDWLITYDQTNCTAC